MPMILRKYISDDELIRYLKKTGYSIINLGEVLKKHWGFKTYEEIANSLHVNKSLLSRKFAYKEDTKAEFFRKLELFVNTSQSLPANYMGGRYCSGIYSLYSRSYDKNFDPPYVTLDNFRIERVASEELLHLLKKELNKII